MLGLLRPKEGRIIYRRGLEIVNFESVRPSIAYMPQSQSLYPDLSIGEHLDFFRALYGIPPEEYERKREELLHITRLAPFTDRPAGKLSGGMYKKLGLMCALLRSPQVMLLDEPTNGVDPISRREFWASLSPGRSGHPDYRDDRIYGRGRALRAGPPARVRARGGRRRAASTAWA